MSEPGQYAGLLREALGEAVIGNGTQVLSDPLVLSSLLADLLPDLPQLTRALLASADVGIASVLAEYAAQGIDARTAIALAAATLERQTLYAADICLLIATELAVALGVPGAAGSGPPTDRVHVGPRPAEQITEDAGLAGPQGPEFRRDLTWAPDRHPAARPDQLPATGPGAHADESTRPPRPAVRKRGMPRLVDVPASAGRPASVRPSRARMWWLVAVFAVALAAVAVYVAIRLSTVSCPSTARCLTDVGRGPRALAVTPDGRTLYVADGLAGTVTPVSTRTDTAGAAIAVGKDPVALVLSKNRGTLYVANKGDGTVTPITVKTGKAGTPIRTGGHPSALALTPDGKTLYVASGTTVTAVNIATNAKSSIPVGPGPLALAMSNDGRTLYAARADGSVTPITTSNDHPGMPIRVGARPSALAISTDGRWLYVASSGDGTVTPVSTATGDPGAPIPIGGEPTALAISRDGQTLYVASGSGMVTPVSTATGLPGALIRVAGAADALAMGSRSDVLYAASDPNVVTVRPLSASPSQQAGFQVISMTYISRNEGWALGTADCGPARCLELLHTTGGGIWTPQPLSVKSPASFGVCPTPQACVQQIAFVGQDGYAFGPWLNMSTDGGGSWSTPSAKNVSSLAASAGGFVVRVKSQTAGCSRTGYDVQGTSTGPAGWYNLSQQPAISSVCPPVLYSQGNRVALVGYGNPARRASALAQIWLSESNGTAWSPVTDRCRSNDGYASAVALSAAASSTVLALLCQQQAPSTAGRSGNAWIRISTNDGKGFLAPQPVPGNRGPAIGTIVHYQLAAANSDVLLIVETGTSGSKLLFTDDGGRTWRCTRPLPGSEPVVLVGYESTSTGRVAQGDTVWTTTDGGKTWTAVHFPAS